MRVTEDRWIEAQAAEHEAWNGFVGNASEFAWATYGKMDVIQWARGVVPGLEALPGPMAEIGIGPFGVGCIHFLRTSETVKLFGIEPLPRMRPHAFPLPYAALFAQCEVNYQQLAEPGESTSLPASSCSLVACYNVLDHCRDADAILREARRILKPAGWFLVACDVVSLAGSIRHRLWCGHRYREEIIVRAHPLRFWQAELENLVARHFRVIAIKNRQGWLDRIFGHSRLVAMIAEKE